MQVGEEATARVPDPRLLLQVADLSHRRHDEQCQSSMIYHVVRRRKACAEQYLRGQAGQLRPLVLIVVVFFGRPAERDEPPYALDGGRQYFIRFEGGA